MANKQTFSFNFDNDVKDSKQNKIAYTEQLVTVSKQRATEALRIASTDEETFKLAETVVNGGEAETLFDFLTKTVGDNVAQDAEFMADASENELSRLLESRRSERSHTKKKGLLSSTVALNKYIAAGYAEMLVRTAWNKPYEATSTIDVDTEDLDAINRKIKSLQSKKSRLNKLVKLGDEDAIAEQSEVIAEIDRLAQFRPTTRTQSTAVIKDIDTDVIREALSKVDFKTLTDEEALKLTALMEKLG